MIIIPRYLLIHIVLLLCVCGILPGHDHSSAHISVENYQTPREPMIVGSGAWTYQLVPGWAEQNAAAFTLGHCHAILEDAYGRLLLLNASEEHCMVVLNPEGVVLDVWGTFAPNAHGLEIVEEDGVEYLLITDNGKNGKVFKTTMDGYVLKTISCPMESGLYETPDDFRPSKTMHLPNGDFFVIDGYGKDYIHRYSADGTYQQSFGGNIGQGEAKLEHWGPHGGAIDFSKQGAPVIILALSDKNKLKRFSLDGSWLETILLPGSNPRDIVFHRDHIVIPHLGDNWPEDKNAAGYISVLDRQFRVVSNLGGEPPEYDRQGKLNTMTHSSHLFHHPHGLCFDQDGNLYVAQFASNGTWPLKFTPITEK
jgi:peptidylamidoglycolate lyase